MKKTIAFIILITGITSAIFGQKRLNYESSALTIKMSDSSMVDIARSPITNRDYLIFILWRMNVYGNNYLSNVVEVFPGLKKKVDDSFLMEFYEAKNPFEFIMDNSQDYIRNYMYNVDYLDYPVLGLTWKQASQFNKWLSDRYNEYELVQNRFYKITTTEYCEECFVTEAYIYNQYYGGKLTNTTISWKDSVLLPCFRLPTRKEVKTLNKFIKSDIQLKNYSKDKKVFLEPWENLYLSIKHNQIRCFNNVILGYKKSIYKINRPDKKPNLNQLEIQELFLDETDSLGNLDYQEALEANGYKIKPKNNFVDDEGYFTEKDSIGYMRFIIIDTDKIGEPKLISNDGFSNGPKMTFKKLTVIRFAVSTNNKKQ